MTTSDITFLSNGYQCHGHCYVPDLWSRPNKLPTIVIVPGGQGMRSTPKGDDSGEGLIELAKHFASSGFVAFCYDGQGQGSPSTGYRDGHHRATEDLQAVLTHLRGHSEVVNGDRIGLFGQSLGGMAAAYAAREDSGIRSLILWGTLPRYSIWKEEQRRNSDGTFETLWEKVKSAPQWKDKTIHDLIEGFRTFDAIDFIETLEQSILFAGSSADKKYFVRADQLHIFDAAKATKRSAFVEIKGQKHRFQTSSPGFALLANLFSTWFSETL